VTIFECFWIQVDDELLARKLQEEESAGLRNKMRKPSKRPVCDVNILQIISILNTHTHTHTRGFYRAMLAQSAVMRQ